MRRDCAARVVTISGGAPADVWCDGGVLRDAAGPILEMARAPALPGAHNAQNAAAAAAMARGARRARAPRSRTASRASRPAAPAAAGRRPSAGSLSSTTARRPTPMPPRARSPATTRVVWIAGGIAKAGGIEPLAPLFPRVAHALLIGRDAAMLAATLASRTASARDRGHAGGGGAGGAARRRGVPARRWCCSRRPAPASTSSPASRRAATGFRHRRSARRDRGGGLMPALSRADNSLLGRWWWTRRSLDAVRDRDADRLRLHHDARGLPGGRRAHRRQSRDLFIVKQVMFLAIAGVVVVAVSLLSPRGRCAGWRSRAVRVALLLTAVTLVHRRRDQGRAALDRAARHVDAAERVPQAVLRRRRRLADRRGQAHAALSRHR